MDFATAWAHHASPKVWANDVGGNMQPFLRAALTFTLILAVGSAVAADAPPSAPRTNPSTSASLLQDGPADNLNRFMLKILDQCSPIADPAQRAECCRHLIENVCVAEAGK
jgi:hypothetical protein